MGYKETVWEMEDTDVQWERAAEYFRAYTGVSISDIPEKFSAYVFSHEGGSEKTRSFDHEV